MSHHSNTSSLPTMSHHMATSHHHTPSQTHHQPTHHHHHVDNTPTLLQTNNAALYYQLNNQPKTASINANHSFKKNVAPTLFTPTTAPSAMRSENKTKKEDLVKKYKHKLSSLFSHHKKKHAEKKHGVVENKHSKSCSLI